MLGSQGVHYSMIEWYKNTGQDSEQKVPCGKPWQTIWDPSGVDLNLI